MNRLFNLRALSAFAALLVLVSCETADPSNEKPSDVVVTFPESVDYTYDAEQSISVTFTPIKMWSLKADQSWVSFEYDGLTQSNVAGPAGKEDVTISLVITPQELLSDQTATITLAIGDKSEVVATVKQLQSFDASQFEVIFEQSGESVSQTTLEWSSTSLAFQSIVTVEAPFDWVVSDYPEWLNTSSMPLAVDANEQARFLLQPKWESYPEAGAEGNIRFESATNSDIYVDLSLKVKDVRDSLFVAAGSQMLTGIDFNADGNITSALDGSIVSTIEFSVIVYGADEPNIFTPECWTEGGEMVYGDGQNLVESAEFAVTPTASNAVVSMGRFTQYNYLVSSKAGKPAMTGILLFPAHLHINSYFTLGDKFWELTSDVSQLPEAYEPYLCGILTRDGGPKEVGQSNFSFLYEDYATMMGASLELMGEDHERFDFYTKELGVPAEGVSLLTYNTVSAQTMAQISLRGFDGNLLSGESSLEWPEEFWDWMAVELSDEYVQISVITNSAQYSDDNLYPLNGYVGFKKDATSDKFDYIIHLTVLSQ